jgi:outer membrane protein OmpA-like peptidoglycan-associated protein
MMKMTFRFFGALALILGASSVAMAQSGAKLPQAKIGIDDIIHFASDSARIEKKSKKILDDLLGRLRSVPNLGKIRMEGHTDSLEKNPQELSLQRAEVIRDYFIKKGFPSSDVEAKGYGNERPIATNTTDEGRARNRRVEFQLVNYLQPPCPGGCVR